jgi:MoaA/NifB/PqqE/SkfB family radical SAM enzyme
VRTIFCSHDPGPRLSFGVTLPTIHDSGASPREKHHPYYPFDFRWASVILDVIISGESMLLDHLVYGIRYVFNHRVLKKNTPLICGLTVTDRCNLKCRHCRVANRDIPDLTFREAADALQSFHEQGGRTLYLQGGEPFIWRDGDHRLEDIVQYSQRLGFHTTIIYTNGTMPIDTSANTVFVSVDGLRDTHDALRGQSFEKIMANVQKSKHSSIYINYTINSLNKDDIAELCEFTSSVDQIRGIFFYFHTPYYGYDELYLSPPQRNEILTRLLAYKKKYNILNSRAGLKAALRNDWARPLDICRVYEKGRTYKCCRYPGNDELCRNCGYLSYAEIDQTLKLKPSAIANAIKYF